MLFISSPSPTPFPHSLPFAARRFVKLAEDAGVVARNIIWPDIYRSRTAQSLLLEEADVTSSVVTHLCVGSWDNAQQLLLAKRNIFHLSWEQPIVSNPDYAHGFKYNMLETLKTYDSVWACADFVNAALQREGLHSMTFPTPICDTVPQTENRRFTELLRIVCTLQERIFSPLFFRVHGKERGDTAALHKDDWKRLCTACKNAEHGGQLHIFLTQGLMGDARKNIVAVMLGFALFAADHPHAVLLVKTHRNLREIYTELESHMQRFFGWGPWGCKNIFIIPANLDDVAQAALYDAADYYLCCPIAEGQNVPLQEAIQHHCYPVTPVHTAMAEYLEPDLVASIATQETPLQPLEYCNAPLPTYTGHVADYMDIADACQQAVDTDAHTRAEHLRILQQEHLARYTFTALQSRLKAALEG